MSFLSESNIIDVNTSGNMTLAEAARMLPRLRGKRVNTSTLWRWCRKGYSGIRLQYCRMGRTITTSEMALQKFFTELAAADSSQMAKSHQNPTIRKRRQTPEHRQKSIDDATAILRRAKIIA